MPGRKPEVTLRTAGGINYEAARRRVKNLNIRVRLDGTVAVSIPLGCSWADADRLVLERREWIERSKAELTARQAKMYRQPLPEKAEALAHFTRMSDEVYPAFAAVLGGQKPTIKVRDMTSRWGGLRARKAADHLCAPALQYARCGADLCGST